MATTTEVDESKTDLSQWTDDQESALLQAIVRWKPVGLHKHFRMIAIRDHLLAQGIIGPDDPHTTSTGIWKKLDSLYDLAKLDEREDSIIDAGDDTFRDFELPREDFEELMWQKRLAPDGTQSPDWSRRESTVADTDEPRSSPVPGSVKPSRPGRVSRRSGRVSQLQNEVETESKGSRRTSKANSVAEVDEDQVMEDAGEEDHDDAADEHENRETEEEEESDEQPEEEEEEEKKTPSARGGRGGRRGRGRRGRRK
ncbi:chromatin modification-related protein EAF7-domain-containing protein [Exophiala viscosa]|uniref:Chromatin modification-related protein EAF7-domain-containing protein n=1 Tax=Exophiala viscosa TaxID=2486360 RepID=A0AAN6DS28_9EURO|nr:chromatin modification-related protein EAF7-domain-containing protein [Exophiala viscosa]